MIEYRAVKNAGWFTGWSIHERVDGGSWTRLTKFTCPTETSAYLTIEQLRRRQDSSTTV